MEKLLMLGDRLCSKQIVEHAQSLGIHTIVTDYYPPEISRTKQLADEYWMISTADIDALEEKCRQEGVTMVMAGVNEFNIENQMDLCKRLGLPCYCTPETFHFNRDKADFKDACRKYGVPTAKQYFFSEELTDEELNAVEYPVVSKAPDRCYNIGMSFCHNAQELREGIEKAKKASYTGRYIVEKMLTGQQYYAYYAFADGEVRLLNFGSSLVQPGYPTNCYCVNTMLADCHELYRSEIDANMQAMFRGIGCREGVASVQFMADEKGALHALEMAYRLGGDLTWIPFKEVSGFSCLEWMFNYARFGKNDPAKMPAPRPYTPGKYATSYIMWTSREANKAKITGLDKVMALPHTFVNVFLRDDYVLGPYNYGITFAFPSDSAEQVCSTIDYINKTISAITEDGEDCLIRFTQFDTLRKLN